MVSIFESLGVLGIGGVVGWLVARRTLGAERLWTTWGASAGAIALIVGLTTLRVGVSVVPLFIAAAMAAWAVHWRWLAALNDRRRLQGKGRK